MNSKTYIKPRGFVAASGAFAGWVFALSVVGGCQDRVPELDAPPKIEQDKPPPEPTDLESFDIREGFGPVAEDGDELHVNYVGRLKSTGLKFDSNEGKDPFTFTVGKGVIDGWSKGVVGMKVGGKRRLTIPSKLGYGETGSPPKIPGGATLEFEIELLSITGKGDEGAGGKADEDAGVSPKPTAAPKAAAPTTPTAPPPPTVTKPVAPPPVTP